MDNENDIRTDAEPAPQPRQTISRITLAVLTAAAVVLGLVGIDVAAVSAARGPKPRPIVQVTKVSGVQAAQPVVYLMAGPGIKPGPDGQLHDAFSVTNFYVHPGQPVKLIINNTDDVPHSINAPSIGVNIMVRPGTHAYTLLVRQTGVFKWDCMLPCDPYSMSHVGYMEGYITST
jgi:heme/copper-type cytochrome/quinol oxidase subunit 2